MRATAEKISLGAATSWPASAPPGSILLGEAGGIAGLVALVGDDGVPQPFVPASFVPSNDNLTDLGDASHRFRSLYLGTSIINAGALAIQLSGNPLTVGGSVQPSSDGAFDLGSSGLSYGTLWLGTGIAAGAALLCRFNTVGTGALTVDNLQAGQVADVRVSGRVRVGADAWLGQLSAGQVNLQLGATEVLRATTTKVSAPDQIGFLADGTVLVERYAASSLRFVLGSSVLQLTTTAVTVQQPLEIAAAGGAISATAVNSNLTLRPNGTGQVVLAGAVGPAKFTADDAGVALFGGAPTGQLAAIPDLGAFTDPPSAAEMATLRTTINSILAALRPATGIGLIQT